MSSSYRQFAPRQGLSHLVDAYWLNVCEPEAGPKSRARVLPDGCIDLVLRAEPGSRQLFASALSTEPYEVPERPGSWFVGVRFRPAMARVVLDVPPIECRDANIEAVAIDPGFAELARRLGDANGPLEALALIQAEVEARSRQSESRAAPRRVREALALLQGGEPPSSRQLAERLGLAERSLQREMVAWAGLAPKVLARIFRMQRATQLIRGGGRSLAGVALETGYADQPHMTRELRRLTGSAPGAHLPP